MSLVKCTVQDAPQIIRFYNRVVEHLQKRVNYPKWSAEHPSEQSIAQAIQNGTQYAYVKPRGPSGHTATEKSAAPADEFLLNAAAEKSAAPVNELLGAVVLNEDPEGYYEAGDWSQELERGEFLVLHVLAVDPDVSHTGVGKAIVENCIEFAWARGYKAIRIDVVPENEPAIRLYEKLGFRYAGTKDLLRNIPEVPKFVLYELLL